MTRLRGKTQTDFSDGGAFHGSNRPPAELIPSAFHKQFDEYDRLWERIQKGNDELARMNRDWGVLQETARKADVAEAHLAARSETPVSVSTPNRNALNAKREQAIANVDALDGALSLIRNDLADIRETEKQNLKQYTDAEKKARANLAKAMAALESPINELVTAIALREWLNEQQPWDASANFDVIDLWAPAGRLGVADKATKAVSFDAIRNALNNL